MFRRSHVTLTKLLLPVFFFVVPFVVTCPDGNCLVGGFFFALGRDMLDNHALVGHVFNSNTVTEPMSCFKKCQSDCRCISFNYLPSEKQDNCQLNNENKNTNSSALQPNKGSQYYDLVINYKIRSDAQFSECQNGCCGTQPCLNGGTCHETCDVTKERFICSCRPEFVGKYCETVLCPTGWLVFRNSCFKKSQRTLTWNSAQEACGNLNSNLTSIHSAEEAQFIYKNLVPGSSKVWIGFNDITTEDVFVWADGSDVKYTDWRTSSGEPNDFGRGEDCTIIIVRDLKWVDFPCDKKLPFICRFTPVYLTVC